MKSLCIDYIFFVSCFGLGIFQCLQRKNFGADSPLVQENFRWVCCDNLLLGTRTHTDIAHLRFYARTEFPKSICILIHLVAHTCLQILCVCVCIYICIFIYIHTCCLNCFQPFPVGPSNIYVYVYIYIYIYTYIYTYIYIRAVCCMHRTFPYAHRHMHIHITHHTSRIITLRITHTHSRTHAHMHTCTHSHTHTHTRR